MVGNANDDPDFLHKILLINTQIANIPKLIAYNLLANVKSSKNTNI